MSELIMIIYMVVLVFTIFGISLIVTEEEVSSNRYIVLPMVTIGVATILVFSIYGAYYIARHF